MNRISRLEKKSDYYKNLDLLSKYPSHQNYPPPLRHNVPLVDFLSKKEVYIYESTRGIPFEDLHPEFQRIMREEFLS